MIYSNPHFPEIDITLRRGGHINRSFDIVWYQFLLDHFDEFKDFYERYHCSLIKHQEGFFFLLSQGDILKTKILPKACMHLGLFLAFKKIDPEITRTFGKLTMEQLFQAMETMVPHEILQKVYAPKQKEAVQYSRIRDAIRNALDTLKDLQFIKITGDTIQITDAISRFMELPRHDNNPDFATREFLSMQRGVVFDIENSDESIGEKGEDDKGSD